MARFNAVCRRPGRYCWGYHPGGSNLSPGTSFEDWALGPADITHYIALFLADFLQMCKAWSTSCHVIIRLLITWLTLRVVDLWDRSLEFLGLCPWFIWYTQKMPNHIVQNEKEYHIPIRTVSLIVYAQTRFSCSVHVFILLCCVCF